MKLKDRVIVITGDAISIGKVTALKCTREGVKVAICDILVDAGLEVVGTIRGEGLTANYDHTPFFYMSCIIFPHL